MEINVPIILNIHCTSVFCKNKNTEGTYSVRLLSSQKVKKCDIVSSMDTTSLEVVESSLNIYVLF